MVVFLLTTPYVHRINTLTFWLFDLIHALYLGLFRTVGGISVYLRTFRIDRITLFMGKFDLFSIDL